MKNLYQILFVVFLTVNVHYIFAQNQVTTQFGVVEGSKNGNVFQFLGIPFAKPPVDSLRWRAPQNPDVWQGILQTTSFKPACVQIERTQLDTAGKLKGSEDCLYLNVWTPKLDSSKRAVMVFIHGGGNQQGSACDSAGNTPVFFGKNMAERSDVVVVTIQYRLGALGYLVYRGLDVENQYGKSGNYAVLDQILALKWVKNNIEKFGGDAANVMVFGESAGGINAGNLMITHMASGLFHKIGIQSAVPNLTTYADAKNKGNSFVNSFANISGTDAQKVAYLRSLPADSIVVRNGPSPLQGGVVQQNFQPTLDGVVFTQMPTPYFTSGNFNNATLLIGSNKDEMSLSVPPVVTPAMVTALVNLYVPAAYRTQILALYPPGNNNTDARKSYVNILSDAQFTTSVRRTARCVSMNQQQPVWRYYFTYANTLPQLAPYGSYHGIELLYVFNNLENATFGQGNLLKPSDDSMQTLMRNYWTNFAKTGNPNGSNFPNWVQYEAASDCYMELKATPNGSQCKLLETKLDLWDEIMGFTACAPPLGITKLNSDLNFSVYPNPSFGIWHFEIKNDEFEGWTVQDLSGKIITNGSEKMVDISSTASGIYLLNVKCKTNNYKHLLIKN